MDAEPHNIPPEGKTGKGFSLEFRWLSLQILRIKPSVKTCDCKAVGGIQVVERHGPAHHTRSIAQIVPGLCSTHIWYV